MEPSSAAELLDTDGHFKPLPEETFVWVVTKREVRWVRSELGTAALRREVAALRCGLDYEGSWAIESSPCPQLTGVRIMVLRRAEANSRSGSVATVPWAAGHGSLAPTSGQALRRRRLTPDDRTVTSLRARSE